MPINEWSDDILIVRLSDEPMFSEDMTALFRRLDDRATNLPDVVINLEDIHQINSSNLAHLLRARKRLTEGESRLRICSVNDETWSVFLLTGLDQVFDFTADVSTALASLQIES